MAIQLRIRKGELEAISEDVKELAALIRELISQTASSPTVLKTAVMVQQPNDSNSSRTLSAKTKQMLRMLSQSPGGLPSHLLAKSLGTEPRGLGSLIGSLYGWGKQYNLTKKQLVVGGRKKDQAGNLVRTIRIADALLKRIQSGEVKLD